MTDTYGAWLSKKDDFFIFFLHNSTDYVILRRKKITIKIIPAMKKIFSFVIVLAAVAMVGCAGNSNKKAAEAEAEAQATEAAVECTEACDSTKVCAEACDSTNTVAVEETAVEENK